MSDVAVQLPLYGCLTGIELSVDRLEVVPGIVLRRVFVDMFGASMLAFAPPPARSSPHPASWVALREEVTPPREGTEGSNRLPPPASPYLPKPHAGGMNGSTSL